MVQGSSIMNLEMTRNHKPLDLCDLTTQNIQINASYIGLNPLGSFTSMHRAYSIEHCAYSIVAIENVKHRA